MTLSRVVGKIGKGRIYVGVSTPKSLADVFAQRAEALGWSRAQFALAVWEKWQAEGCPPVSPADDALLKLKLSPSKPAIKAS
jgi:hypothetical protein